MNEMALAAGCAMYPCVEGCGEPVLRDGATCPECAELAREYDSAEPQRRWLRWHARTAPADRHLGAVERAARPDRRMGVFTFLGWNGAGPAKPARLAPACGPARLAAESEAAPACGDAARRSELMERLPRVHAGVRAYAMERAHLWHSDVPLLTVLAIVAWDGVRCVWWGTADALCLLAARHLRTKLRLQVFCGVVGAVLSAAAGLLADRVLR